MLKWLWNLLFGKPVEERYDVYKPSERKIFTYFDGVKDVHADPMDVAKALADAGVGLSTDLKVMHSPSKRRWEACQNAYAKLVEIFHLPPVSEGGLTKDEAFDLFARYLTFEGRLKKNWRLFPTPPAATSSTPPSTTEDVDVTSATPSSSACGSTAPVRNTEPPSPPSSPTASPPESSPPAAPSATPTVTATEALPS